MAKTRNLHEAKSPSKDQAAEAPLYPEIAAARLIDVRTVARLLSCCRATVWNKVARGQLPPPLNVHGLRRWRFSDIEAVIKAAEREGEEAA